jgi:hypothetical protein
VTSTERPAHRRAGRDDDQRVGSLHHRRACRRRYRVTAFAEGLAAPESIEVNLEPGRPSGEIVLRLLPASRLSGVVSDGRDPIVGAKVSLGFGQPESVDAVTQSDGSFVIDPVARGVATVEVRPYEVRDPKTIRIDRADVSGVRITVDTMGSIAGRVTQQGKPVAGAKTYVSMRLEPTYPTPLHHVQHSAARPLQTIRRRSHTRVSLWRRRHARQRRASHRRRPRSVERHDLGSVVEPGKPVAGVSVMFEARATTWARRHFARRQLLRETSSNDDYRISVAPRRRRR